MNARIYRAIGLMSGTSMDGIDVAAIETDGVTVSWLGPVLTVPYAPGVRAALGEAIRHPDDDATRIEIDITAAHIEAVRRYLDLLPADRREIELIGLHGHTLFHRPERHQTRQIGDGVALARATGIDVVHDFRTADVDAGGEGAPLAPVYHRALAENVPGPLVFVNIGGVSNITFIDGEAMLAFDTGPGNALIDDWVLARAGHGYDEGGGLAARGAIDASALALLLDKPFFARKPPKSLDRLDFDAAPVQGLSLEDGAATLTAFTARAIGLCVQHLPAEPRRWLVTGGGRHNPTLMKMLAASLPGQVSPVEAIGADGDGLEAQAFAFMAVRSVLGSPISFPGTTGAPCPMTGGKLAAATAEPA